MTGGTGSCEHLGTYRKVKRVGVVIGGHVRCRCKTEDPPLEANDFQLEWR